MALQKQLHMITGLPRAGSTLLSCILKQNPDMHATVSDPLAAVINSAVNTINAYPNAASLTNTIDLVTGLVDGFYKSIDKQIVFNTSPNWTYLTPLVKQTFPKAKMIVCVRDINKIIDSFEQSYRRNPLLKNAVPGDSVYERADYLMSTSGLIGAAYVGVKQAITSNEKRNLMLIEYDQLCKNPSGIISALYNFIGAAPYAHDFNKVEASWDELDQEYTAQSSEYKKVELKQFESVLPPDIASKYANMEVWRM